MNVGQAAESKRWTRMNDRKSKLGKLEDARAVGESSLSFLCPTKEQNMLKSLLWIRICKV
jgi:hypothetical protein